MATVTITIADNDDGKGIVVDAKTSDPTSLCHANILAQFITSNLDQLMPAALRLHVAQQTLALAQLEGESQAEESGLILPSGVGNGARAAHIPEQNND
jgi:hypothetical protein